jgi:hypothetical protein
MIGLKKIREATEFLLEEIAPNSGASVLMLRHPVGNVYFPVSIAVGKNHTAYSTSVLDDYFLFATQLDFEDDQPFQKLLDDRSELRDLVLHGKLATYFFNRQAVSMNAYPCSSNNETALLQLHPELEQSSVPSQLRLQALGRIASGWQELASLTTQVDVNDQNEIVDRLGALFRDGNHEPPYFPFLHTRVNWKNGRQIKSGKWFANSLSFNCYLAHAYEELRREYIASTFKTVVENDVFEDRAPLNSNSAFARQIASQCTDVVKLLSTNQSETTCGVLARLNVLNETVETVSSQHVHSPKVLNSNWDLVRSAIEFLRQPQRESVLVTAWVGTLNDGTDALPIGMAPGSKMQELTYVAESEDVAPFRNSTWSECGRLGLEGILLPALNTESKDQSTVLVQNILNRSAKVLSATESRFVPTRVFCSTQSCVIFDASCRELEFKASTLIHSVLSLIAISKNRNSIAMHKDIVDAAKAYSGASESTGVIEEIRKKLLKFGVPRDSLVESKKKKGYTFLDNIVSEVGEKADENAFRKGVGSVVNPDQIEFRT